MAQSKSKYASSPTVLEIDSSIKSKCMLRNKNLLNICMWQEHAILDKPTWLTINLLQCQVIRKSEERLSMCLTRLESKIKIQYMDLEKRL